MDEPRRPNAQMVADAVDHALRKLEAGRSDPRQVEAGFNVLMLLASASSGECRQETPYGQLHPVIDEHGNFMWCCNHPKEHCAR